MKGRIYKSNSPIDGQLAIFRPRAKSGFDLDLLGFVFGLNWEQRKKMISRLMNISGIPIIDPIYLLRCKLVNLKNLPQTRRNDLSHVKIMLLVVRCHLRKMLINFRKDEITARGAINETKLVLEFGKISDCRDALKMAERTLADAIPLTEFRACRDEKIARFVESSLEPLF